MNTDADLMRRAIELARRSMQSEAGGPFGAVVARDGEIIGEGWNRVTSSNDPTAHAEITAIREACSKTGSFQLEGCVIYASCEPCPMCLGAIYWARPERLVFAATREDAAAAGFDDDFIYGELGADISSRRMPTATMMRDDAARVLEEWKQLTDKIEY